MEGELNAQLVLRSHGKVELTVEGQLLAKVMTETFERLAETLHAIRRPASADAVIVRTTLAFSRFRPVPRLPAFRAAHPGIRLRPISRDAGFDLRQGRLHAAVRYGAPPLPDGESLGSMPDGVVPVCSPALVAAVRTPPALGTLAAFPLIGLEWQNAAWLSWPRWAAMAGLAEYEAPLSKPEPTRRCATS